MRPATAADKICGLKYNIPRTAGLAFRESGPHLNEATFESIMQCTPTPAVYSKPWGQYSLLILHLISWNSILGPEFQRALINVNGVKSRRFE